jgi:hypothetical protein
LDQLLLELPQLEVVEVVEVVVYLNLLPLKVVVPVVQAS